MGGGGPEIHPNQEVVLDEVEEDEMVENKLVVIPDDMVNYLNEVVGNIESGSNQQQNPNSNSNSATNQKTSFPQTKCCPKAQCCTNTCRHCHCHECRGNVSVRKPSNASSATAEIQCGDISQSEASTPTCTVIDNSTVTPKSHQSTAYQRTLEYVQNCQSWTSMLAAPPNHQGNETNVDPNAKSSSLTSIQPHDGLVSSTTILPPQLTRNVPITNEFHEPQPQTQPLAQPVPFMSNMMLNDMNTSLSSLMEENRCLKTFTWLEVISISRIFYCENKKLKINNYQTIVF